MCSAAYKRIKRSVLDKSYVLLFVTIISVLVPHAFTCVLRVQSQVDEVIDVMQENISKVIERGERLDDLQDKSGESHKSCMC